MWPKVLVKMTIFVNNLCWFDTVHIRRPPTFIYRYGQFNIIGRLLWKKSVFCKVWWKNGPVSIIWNVQYKKLDRPIRNKGYFDRPFWISPINILQEKIKFQNVFSVLLILFTRIQTYLYYIFLRYQITCIKLLISYHVIQYFSSLYSYLQVFVTLALILVISKSNQSIR